MPETSVAWRVRLRLAILATAIWRQRNVVLASLALGVLLGSLVPSSTFTSDSYKTTIRMEVLRSPVDTLLQPEPTFVGGEREDGTATEALKDLAVADAVAKRLPRRYGELTGTALLANLAFRPVRGTSFVDVTYTTSDPQLAATVVKQYTKAFASRRNAVEKRRLANLLHFLEGVASRERDDAARLAAEERLAQARLAQNPVPLTAVIGDPVVTASTPRLSRRAIVALGILLGLIVGLGAALLRTASKVISPRDAERASELPLVGAVRKNGVRGTPLAVVDRPFSPAAEDYHRLATSLRRRGLGDGIQVLAVVSPDAKDGKTVLAANLAYSLALQGHAVVLISSDLRQPRLEKVLGLGQRPGLADSLQDESIPAVALLVSINDHLLVLPAGQSTKHPSELLASARLPEIVQTAREIGTVILDTPAARPSGDATALSAVADATLLVARSGVTPKRSVSEVASVLRRDLIRQLGVVLVGTSSALPSGSSPSREQPQRVETEDQEQSVVPRPPTKLTPKRITPGPSPEETTSRRSSVTGLTVAAERNRRVAK
jgi:Mrp family chromosome partitioning ATPase/capsular polysaccharide biosynthesis protein